MAVAFILPAIIMAQAQPAPADRPSTLPPQAELPPEPVEEQRVLD